MLNDVALRGASLYVTNRHFNFQSKAPFWFQTETLFISSFVELNDTSCSYDGEGIDQSVLQRRVIEPVNDFLVFR